MLARTDSRARAWSFSSSSRVVASAIGARLVWWQVVQQEWLAGDGARTSWPSRSSFPAERGEITDVNGALLATSVELQSVFATPPMIDDPARPRGFSPRSSTSTPPSCGTGSTAIEPGSG